LLATTCIEDLNLDRVAEEDIEEMKRLIWHELYSLNT